MTHQIYLEKLNKDLQASQEKIKENEINFCWQEREIQISNRETLKEKELELGFQKIYLERQLNELQAYLGFLDADSYAEDFKNFAYSSKAELSQMLNKPRKYFSIVSKQKPQKLEQNLTEISSPQEQSKNRPSYINKPQRNNYRLEIEISLQDNKKLPYKY